MAMNDNQDSHIVTETSVTGAGADQEFSRPDPSIIDAGIYPLLEALWDVGIKTDFSCSFLIEDHSQEDNPPRKDLSRALGAHVIFQRCTEEQVRFLDEVAIYSRGILDWDETGRMCCGNPVLFWDCPWLRKYMPNNRFRDYLIKRKFKRAIQAINLLKAGAKATTRINIKLIRPEHVRRILNHIFSLVTVTIALLSVILAIQIGGEFAWTLAIAAYSLSALFLAGLLKRRGIL
jgi:hypothetical protein